MVVGNRRVEAVVSGVVVSFKFAGGGLLLGLVVIAFFLLGRLSLRWIRPIRLAAIALLGMELVYAALGQIRAGDETPEVIFWGVLITTMSVVAYTTGAINGSPR